VNVELPPTHPLATLSGQFIFVGGIAWRWLAAGALGFVLGWPIVSLILGLILLHLWLRSFRHENFWTPYFDEMKGAPVWVSRVGLLGVAALGVWSSSSDDRFWPYLLAWVGFCLALVLESFLVPIPRATSKE
jgi:hypothetical protein